ncbi:MAG: hypothetical protein R2684_13000 [Pyrinomonadaceae bacterium]
MNMNMSKIASASLQIVAISCFIAFGSLKGVSQVNDCECREIRPLLATLSKDVGDENHAISKLMEIGDSCIDELIAILNGKEFQLSVAAQEALRYLGNERGVAALEVWNRHNTTPYPVKGPVPLPIMEFDYEMIELNFLGKNPRDMGLLSSQYLYALAIDADSPKSKILFEKMLKALQAVDNRSITRKMLNNLSSNYPLKPFSGSKGLEIAVLENAFFLSGEDKKVTKATLLGFNGRRDKALLELYLSRGLLAEEWYHVVVNRQENDWKFYSITFVKQS